jgi:hypothetical protein
MFEKMMVGKRKQASLLLMLTNVKNTDTAENKGYDAGKKVSGIKRHIAVDTSRVTSCDSYYNCDASLIGLEL